MTTPVCIKRIFPGGKENQTFVEWADFTIQDETVAIEIAERMLARPDDIARPEPEPTEPNPFLAGLDTSASINKKMDALEHAHEARRERHEDERASLIRRAREADLDDEKRRQVSYIVTQMEGPRQDVAHLVARLNEILRTNNRG